MQQDPAEDEGGGLFGFKPHLEAYNRQRGGGGGGGGGGLMLPLMRVTKPPQWSLKPYLTKQSLH